MRKPCRPCRDDEPGASWHVTVRVNWRLWHLEPAPLAECFLEVLLEAMEAFAVDMLAFVLMSNHCHLVPRSPSDPIFSVLTSRRTPCRHRRPWPVGHWKSSVLSQFMQRVLYRTSRAIQKALGRSGRFWEGRFHARRIEDSADLIRTVAYDHLNPVEQGMVIRPEEYPRGSAAWWAGTGDSPIPLVVQGLPFSLDLADFRRRLKIRTNDRRLRRAIRRIHEEGLGLDSDVGRARLERILKDIGESDADLWSAPRPRN